MGTITPSSNSPVIQHREVVNSASDLLVNIDPILRRVYLSRGITNEKQLDRRLKYLPNYASLTGIERAVSLIKNTIQADKRIVVVADFDADGATSCAVAVRGLRMLGAKYVEFVVPDRFKFGYGLTPEIVDVALALKPDLIITVDNGISSVQGVDHAHSHGCQVVITDHHLPPANLPAAEAIVNPQLKGDQFPSKALAGVGVIFYVLLALRAKLGEEGQFKGTVPPKLADLLDIVALGTVADVVPMDETNRKLVHQGLLRIKSLRCVPGIKALLSISKREPSNIIASDLGFAVAPRLNAAGRLDDMSLGIQCLLTDNEQEAIQLAEQLDALNAERRLIEDDMKVSAFKALESLKENQESTQKWGICLYNSTWHQGVIGILASRVKDRLNRPVIAFALAGDGEIKGSARSIAGLHIRDTLDDIASEFPQLLRKFGGHAMAAGMSLAEQDFELFTRVFDQAVERRLNGQEPSGVFLVDGEIPSTDLTLDLAETLRQGGPWGQLFPEPSFVGNFKVKSSRIVGQKHVKFELYTGAKNRMVEAIYFNPEDPDQLIGLPIVKLVYQLDINRYLGRSSLQLMVQHLEKI